MQWAEGSSEEKGTNGGMGGQQREEAAEARDFFKATPFFFHEQCPGKIPQHALDGLFMLNYPISYSVVNFSYLLCVIGFLPPRGTT